MLNILSNIQKHIQNTSSKAFSEAYKQISSKHTLPFTTNYVPVYTPTETYETPSNSILWLSDGITTLPAIYTYYVHAKCPNPRAALQVYACSVRLYWVLGWLNVALGVNTLNIWIFLPFVCAACWSGSRYPWLCYIDRHRYIQITDTKLLLNLIDTHAPLHIH